MIKPQPAKNRFSVNIALISIFSAIWVILNLTVAPLSFAVLHLPVIHSVIIFLTLLLVVWATGQFGASITVGIIGSIIVVFAGGPIPVLGFIPAAILFDIILLANKHKINLKPINITIAILAAIVCSFVAALANGFLILNLAWIFTLTVWSAWNILGGIIGVILALPVVGALERAQVKRVKTE